MIAAVVGPIAFSYILGKNECVHPVDVAGELSLVTAAGAGVSVLFASVIFL